MARLKGAVELLGLKRSIVGLLGMVVLVGMGEHMAERFLPIYILALGGSAIAIGVLNGMDNLLSALYSFPGGYLSDRLGTKRALLVFNLTAMVGFVLVILIPNWIAVLVGAVFFLSWTAISLPATMDLVSRVLPKNKRTLGVSLHSLVRRIPMAVGPVLGGVLITFWGERDGVRLAFVAALVMAVVALIMQQILIEEHPSPNGSNVAEKNPFRVLRDMSPPLRNLLVSDILIRFCEQIPYAFVVVWCMGRINTPASAFQFGILTALEMTTAVLIYIPVAYLADRSGKKPFVAMTFVFFTLFPMALLCAQSFYWLIPVFVLRGFKEFGEPARKALIMDLAPEGRKAAMFGLYYLIRDVIVSLAAFGGAFLWQISPQVNFVAAACFGVLGTVWFVFQGTDLTADTERQG